MGARHRMTERRGRRQSAIGQCVRRAVDYCAAISRVVRISMPCAMALAALTLNSVDSEQTPQPVSQEGVLIAVSADSVTARSANGYTQTYRITPDTTVVTARGRQPVSATSHFRVNEEVAIVGTATRGGTALATTVAERRAWEMALGRRWITPTANPSGGSDGDRSFCAQKRCARPAQPLRLPMRSEPSVRLGGGVFSNSST